MSGRPEASESIASITAHRGDSSRHRENTLSAIRSAIESGAEFVEVDIRITADGQVVLLHDATLLRLWGVDKFATKLPYSDIADLGTGEERIPLLRDALDLFRDTTSTLLIDIDEEDPPAAAALVVRASEAAAVVLASGVEVAWCGNLEAMRRIRTLDATARIWLPWDQRVAPSRELLDELQPEFVNSEYVILSRKLVDDIHALGARVSCWTVDDAAAMQWVLRLGVDSVTTNDLALLRETLRIGPASWGLDEPAGRLTGSELFEASETARDLAEWAINYTRSADLGVISTKAHPGDLVTEVDVAVERHVREVIGAKFPDHNFVGEEMGGEAQNGVPCWYLDPVDGTTNFANHIPWTSFSLALAIDHVPYVAVVSEPWRGDVFEAIAGHGARLNGVALSLPAAGESGDPLNGRVVSTELAGQLPWPGMIELLGALGERYAIMRIMGSATLTVVGIAAGRGAGSIIGQFSAVDHVAAALIVQEAGGVVLDSDGLPNPFPASGGILVATPGAADELYGIWRAACDAAKNHSGGIPTS